MSTATGQASVEAPLSNQPAQAPCAVMAGCACAVPVQVPVPTAADSSIDRIPLGVLKLHAAIPFGLIPPPRA